MLLSFCKELRGGGRRFDVQFYSILSVLLGTKRRRRGHRTERAPPRTMCVETALLAVSALLKAGHDEWGSWEGPRELRDTLPVGRKIL